MEKLSKLTIRREDVEQSDILSKKELKSIMGGYDPWDGPWQSVWCQCANGFAWVCVGPCISACVVPDGCRGNVYCESRMPNC